MLIVVAAAFYMEGKPSTDVASMMELFFFIALSTILFDGFGKWIAFICSVVLFISFQLLGAIGFLTPAQIRDPISNIIFNSLVWLIISVMIAVLITSTLNTLRMQTEQARIQLSKLNRAERSLKKKSVSIDQLYEAGKNLGQSLDLDEIYQSLHAIISNTMACDGMIVACFNPQTELITCETMWHEDKRIDVSAFPPIPLEPKSKGTQSLVIRSGNSLYLADYQAHQGTSKNSYYIDQEGIAKNQTAPKDELITSSAILVPLKREGQVIGVIQVYSYKLDDFSKDDLQFLEAFSPQISAAITNAALFQETKSSKNQLQDAFRGTIDVIAAAVEMRDPYTAGHQRRVSHLAVHIARQLGLHIDQIEGIRMAGFIHDLGKINIPIEILSKPGKLSEMEFALIKTHPQNGYEMLKKIHFPWPIAEMILQHHENMDGSGYPNGLKGDAILLEAKILTVADVVEAMSSDRPYRPALGTVSALQEIKDQRGKRYEQELVDACIQIFQDGYQFSD